MTNTERVFLIIESLCNSEKGQYTWLDDTIDLLIDNSRELLYSLPSDDILNDLEVQLICDDHHDGFINEVYITYTNPEYKGLCIRISDMGYDIINEDGDVIDWWEATESKSETAREIYEVLINELSKKKKICRQIRMR
ncbi:MAG: hypothetical protein Q4E68_07625 [Prevotellaceae bacterium]|nr:hypothetical protein [Prevotellaceae bacterium]